MSSFGSRFSHTQAICGKWTKDHGGSYQNARRGKFWSHFMFFFTLSISWSCEFYWNHFGCKFWIFHFGCTIIGWKLAAHQIKCNVNAPAQFYTIINVISKMTMETHTHIQFIQSFIYLFNRSIFESYKKKMWFVCTQ